MGATSLDWAVWGVDFSFVHLAVDLRDYADPLFIADRSRIEAVVARRLARCCPPEALFLT